MLNKMISKINSIMMLVMFTCVVIVSTLTISNFSMNHVVVAIVVLMIVGCIWIFTVALINFIAIIIHAIQRVTEKIIYTVNVIIDKVNEKRLNSLRKKLARKTYKVEKMNAKIKILTHKIAKI